MLLVPSAEKRAGFNDRIRRWTNTYPNQLDVRTLLVVIGYLFYEALKSDLEVYNSATSFHL
jgi:hypothetical protein